MPKGRRLERLTQRLKEILSRIILYELKDPRLGFATITRVSLAPDLTRAVVYVSVMGEDAKERSTLRALEHARGHIQSEVASSLDIRRHPEIIFEADRGLKHSMTVSRILSELREEAMQAPDAEADRRAEAAASGAPRVEEEAET